MLKEIIISKAGFMLYSDYWNKYLSKMSGDQVKECMKIIFNFSETFEEIKSDDLAVEMVATTIIDNLKRDAQKMERRFVTNKVNGAKGGRPPKKKPNSPPKEGKEIECDDFEAFWKIYDHKKSKALAAKSFAKALKVDSLENIIEGLGNFC